MNPRDLPLLAALALVARHGSFARAAVELGMSRSALSHAVRELEARMGVRLLNRTTRSLSPTAAGARLIDQVAPALACISQAVDEANRDRDRPRGRLRLNVPRVAALIVLAPALHGFLAAHPDLELEIAVEDATVDIVAEGFDAGIRFGERLGGAMIAIPIGLPVGFAVVGSPDYFSQRAPPLTPDDLAEHACIRYRMRGSGRLFDWEFEREGREVAVTVDGRLTLDAPEFMVRAAVDGLGLAYVPLVDAEPHLKTGQLVRVLADWCPPTARLQLYYPDRRHLPATLRALIDWLRT